MGANLGKLEFWKFGVKDEAFIMEKRLFFFVADI